MHKSPCRNIIWKSKSIWHLQKAYNSSVTESNNTEMVEMPDNSKVFSFKNDQETQRGF
jgi:hypothetical protein